MQWIKASERMPQIGDKKLFFVIADDLYKIVCGLNYKGEFCEFPDSNPVRWAYDRILWLDESPASAEAGREDDPKLKEFIELSANRHTYRVCKKLPDQLSYAAIGDKFDSSTLYDAGYNIEKLVKYGYIRLIDEPYEWQKWLVGKNEGSVFNICGQCGNHGVNFPLDNKCGNCGYTKTKTYYDADTIDMLLINHPTTEQK